MFKNRKILLSISLASMLPIASSIALLSASCDKTTKQIKKAKTELSSVIKNNVKSVVDNDKTLDKNAKEKLTSKDFDEIIEGISSTGVDFMITFFESLGLSKKDFVSYYNDVIKNSYFWKTMQKGQKSFEELSKLFSQISPNMLLEERDKFISYLIKAWKNNKNINEVLTKDNISDQELKEISKLLFDNFEKINKNNAITNLFIGGYDPNKNTYNKPDAKKQEQMRKPILENLNKVNKNKKYTNLNESLSKYITESIVNNANKFPPLIKKYKEIVAKIMSLFQ